MKNNINKILFISAGIFFSGLVFTSCNEAGKDTNTSDDPKDVAEEHNDAKFDKVKEKEAQFLVDAAEINMKEIHLSAMADTQAHAADVKELAKFLKEDHEKCLKEIQALATKKMVTLPDAATKNIETSTEKIIDKRDTKFDQEYTAMMVDIHEDAIDKFQKAAEDSEDYEIKTFANKMLTQLRTNLDRSMVCRDKYKEKEGKNKDKDHTVIKDMKK
ncbi:MAG: outer membrane protein [Bacteroidota bacterium]|jgi:putative membrane protein|nr:outer membrane protein [Bacteroidota bacterium]